MFFHLIRFQSKVPNKMINISVIRYHYSTKNEGGVITAMYVYV